METKPEKPTEAINIVAKPGMVAKQAAMMERVAPSGTVHYFTPYDMVTAFHAASLCRGLSFIGEINKPVPDEVVKGRKELIDQEVNKELMVLLQKIIDNGGKASLEQKAELLDHACDSIYVIMGLCVNFGLFLDAGFAMVHAANMRKVMRPEGPIFFEEGNPEGEAVGKIKKPAGWTSPNKQLFEMCLAAYSELEMADPRKQTNLKQPAGNDSAATEGSEAPKTTTVENSPKSLQ